MEKKRPIASALYEGLTLIAPNYSKYVLKQVERDYWRTDFERRIYELKHRLRVELHQFEHGDDDWFDVERIDILYRLYRKERTGGRSATDAYYKAVQHLFLQEAA